MKSGMFVEQNETEIISGLLILNKQICSPIRSSQNFQVIDMYSVCSTHSKIYGICGTHNLHFYVNYNLNFSLLLHTGPVLCGEIYDTFKILTCVMLLVLQGTSTKYSPQRVGLTHVMEHEDVIQIVKK